MAEEKKNFYHLMLNLPEGITSPDHYELLGLEHFEDDEDVIQEAAIDANEMLLAWQNSEYHRECDRLMDEVVKARGVLLATKKKAKYDERLRQRLGIEELPDASEEPDDEIALAPLPPSRAKLQRRAKQAEAEKPGGDFEKRFLLVLGGIIAGVLVVGVAIVGISSLLSSGDSQTASPKSLTAMITRATSTPTNADTVAFDVAFSNSVKNVDFRGFQLNLSGVTADPLEAEDVTDASETGSKTFRVTVRNINGNGTLGLDIASSTEILDDAGSTLTPTSTESEVYTIDNAGPSVTLTFPEDGAFYNDESWPQEISGAASESDEVSSLSKVQVAIRQNSMGKYWNGTNAFDSDTAVFTAATGTTSWSLSFSSQFFPADGEYTIEASAADTTGNVGSNVRQLALNNLPRVGSLQQGSMVIEYLGIASLRFNRFSIDRNAFLAILTPVS